ncbi:MAG: hypothetical protein NZ602_11945, partial [Thermoguttaceae bacterium]|nr:hypothetical protein [Thermoguttaceae bacterium]
PHPPPRARRARPTPRGVRGQPPPPPPVVVPGLAQVTPGEGANPASPLRGRGRLGPSQAG